MIIDYATSINNALRCRLENKEDLLIGQGVTSPWYVGTTTKGLAEKYGPKVLDPPVAEGAMMGVAIGAALERMKPIVMFPRMDFMMYAMDQIVNHLINWEFMHGLEDRINLTIWAIINRRGEQAAQHSAALYNIFAQLPKIEVVCPSNPKDVKGMFSYAREKQGITMIVDNRELYTQEGEVPEENYSYKDKIELVREGSEATVICFSNTVNWAKKAIGTKDVEILALKNISTLAEREIQASAKKTGKILVLDPSWGRGSVTSRISKILIGKCDCEVYELALPDTPAPASQRREEKYYFSDMDLLKKLEEII